MADSTWNFAFPAAVFGPDVVQNVLYDTQSQIKSSEDVKAAAGSSSSSATSTSQPTHTHTSRSQRPDTSGVRSTSSRASGKRKAETATERRNKFIPIESPIMPVELEAWATASRTIGGIFDNNQPERPGVPHKYILPESSLFACHSNEGARQAMLKTFLKVRDVLYYDIFTRGTIHCLRYPVDWHRMMGLELHGQKSDKDTHESRLRKKLCVDLQMAASSDANIATVS